MGDRSVKEVEERNSQRTHVMLQHNIKETTRLISKVKLCQKRVQAASAVWDVAPGLRVEKREGGGKPASGIKAHAKD
jgi:hypothetical protein